MTLDFAPLLPIPVLAVVAVVAALLAALGLWRGVRGSRIRALALLALLCAVANPVVLNELRDPLKSVVAVVVDRSQSQASPERKAETDKADAGQGTDKPAAADSEEDPDLAIAAPEKSRRAPDGIADFRDDRWTELYAKKIEEMVAVLKTKHVPILWVGLPAIRGTKSTSDMLFLDSLYRDVAGKTGITYVDVWDGFVDDNGRFLTQGPDFEGQIRRLRSADGVFFTKAGARKLAHYVEREIRRVLSARLSPMAMPTDEPPADTKPGTAGPRPLYGPVLPLVASSVRSDELLGGNGTRPAAVDALAARTMVKGEALDPPAGRADDFAWPRRAIANEPAPVGEPAVATTTAPDHTPGVSAAPPKPKKPRVPHEETAQQGGPVDFRNAPP